MQAAVQSRPTLLFYPDGLPSHREIEVKRQVPKRLVQSLVGTTLLGLVVVSLLIPATLGSPAPKVVYKAPYATSKSTGYDNTFACAGSSAVVVTKPFVHHQTGRLGGALNVTGGTCSLGGLPYSPQAFLFSELRGLAFRPTTSGVHTLLLRWHVAWNASGFAPASCSSSVLISVGGEFFDKATHQSVGSNFTTAYSNFIFNSTTSTNFTSVGIWNGLEPVNVSLQAGHNYTIGAFFDIQVSALCSTPNGAFAQANLASPGLGAWIRSVRVS